MTNVKFSRKEFEKEIKLTQETIEKISLFGTPLESISNEEIEIEIFPNRPDLISIQGYIRSFRQFLGESKSEKKYKINKPLPDYKVKISPSVKKVRPHTVCAIVKGLKLDNEKIKDIISLQEKLHITIGRNRKKVAIGIYPLEKIKLPIKYEAISPKKIQFTPLDSEKEMSALQILKRHPAGKAYAHLLEKEELFPIFSDSANNILSLPPIINSDKTGRVTASTKDVFIECSGHDLPSLNKTLNIIVTALSDMGGEIYQMTLENGGKNSTTPDLTLEKIKLSLENTNAMLGLNLKEADLQKLLSKMGIEYKNKTASVPAWRTDILHEVDLIEDIAIAYGYEKFVPELPNISTEGAESRESRIKSRISELLIGLNLTEVSTYHLIKQEEAEKSKLKEPIELENSKTEYKILRPNLLIPAMRILSENKDNEYPQEIFEIGRVFSHDKKTETGVREDNSLIILLSPANFTKMKQVIDYISQSLGIELSLKESTHPQLIEGRTASVNLKNKEIGHLGEVNPETLRAWTIKMPAAVIEISLEEIFKTIKEN